MNNFKEIENGKILLELIRERAQKNSKFREELIKNPVRTLEKFPDLELKIPSKTKLVVNNQMDPNIIYLNIPRKVDKDDFELTDEELETISGGTSVTVAECILVGAAILGAIVAVNELSEDFIRGWRSLHN